MHQVRYQLSVSDITAHQLSIAMTFTPDHEHPVILSLPAWIPGSYLIRNFARHLLKITATDNSGPLAITALDKHRWQLTHRGLEVRVEYQLYAFDLSVRACYINDEVAVVNPAACCLAVEGQQHLPHLLTILPVANKPHWQVATGLKRAASTTVFEFGDYIASDYAQLIDSPLLLGKLQKEQFELAGVVHRLVFAGAVEADIARITRDLAPICQQQMQVFAGVPADVEEYWFLTWVVDQGYGGLEHHNSTLLLCNRFDLPNPLQPTQLTEDYQNYLALCSHEYFHTWWVKRAKPTTFLQYQLQAEQYTSQLWLYEGFTSYYDDLALIRAGTISQAQYLTTLSKTISRVQRAPSNLKQSLAESSFTAWTKFYQQDENAINAVVSYYAKGSLVALCLDAELRLRGLTLDGLMLRCWQAFGVSGAGSAEDDFFTQLALYSQDGALVQLCRDWVQQPMNLPLTSALAALGIQLDYRAAQSSKDLAGKAAEFAHQKDFGAFYQVTTEGLQITAVVEQSSAYQCGLMAGDLVIAVAGLKATEANLQEMLSRHPVGAQLKLHWFRQQRLLDADLCLQAAPLHIAELSVVTPELTLDWLGVSPRAEAQSSEAG
jgi:predicted metalloprotease with PDZ domain